MSTYESTKILVQSGNYEKQSIMKKLDIFLNLDRITIEQYEELVQVIG